MTQKELSYIEDAISHEKNICSILENTITNLDDKELIQYIKDELKSHQKHQKKLTELLEDECNE